jgi:hypothetical protein
MSFNKPNESKKKQKGIEKVPNDVLGGVAHGENALALMIKERNSRFEKEIKKEDKIAVDKWWGMWKNRNESRDFQRTRGWRLLVGDDAGRGTRGIQLVKFRKWGPDIKGPYFVIDTTTAQGRRGDMLLLTEAEAKEYFQQIRNEGWDKGKELAEEIANSHRDGETCHACDTGQYQHLSVGSLRRIWSQTIPGQRQLVYHTDDDWNILARFLAATRKIHKHKGSAQATFPSENGIASFFPAKDLASLAGTSKSMKKSTQSRMNSLKSWNAGGGRRGSRKRKRKRKRKTKRHKKIRKNKRKKTRKKR